jgi:diguanylate cyclase (GGDEF)-like protein/putative nucleotidyltransferase with HDIG domain
MTWSQLPNKLRIYILSFVVAAVPILLWSISDLHRAQAENGTGWLVLTVLAILTVPFFLFLPSVNATIGIGDSYLIAIAMLYGASPCIIATFCHTVIASVFGRNRPKVYAYRVVFNVSSLVCGSFLYSTIYNSLVTRHQQADLQNIILPAALLMTTLFLFNSISTSVAIAWALNDKVFDFWSKNCLPLAIDFTVSSVSAIFIVSLKHLFDSPSAPLLAAPLVGLVWGWNKVNKSRAMEAEKHLLEQENLYLRTVESLAMAIDAKDQTTSGHIRRVRAYAMGLARLCGIQDPRELKAIETSSLLHDIGKLAIDDYILNKPGPLTQLEYEKIKIHATAGDEILRQIQFPFPVSQYVRYHHEKWDGTGYPDGLSGTQIPIGARILSIADAYDAIRTSRPYKLSEKISNSVEILTSKAGSLYDPELVTLFVSNIAELENAADVAAKSNSEVSIRKYFDQVNTSLSSQNSALLPTPFYLSDTAKLVALSAFCSISDTLLSLQEFSQIVLQRLSDIIPFDSAAIYLDQHDGSVAPIYVIGPLSPTLNSIKIPLGKGISGWVCAHKKHIFNVNPELEFVETETIMSSYGDVLSVPLLDHAESIGAISLYSVTPRRFNQRDVEFLQLSSSFIAPPLFQISNSTINNSQRLDVDPSFGIYTMSFLFTFVPTLITNSQHNSSPFSIINIQLNNLFKNALLHGLPSSNLLLKSIIQSLKIEMRQTDIIIRNGFCGLFLILPDVSSTQASRFAHRIHSLIKSIYISHFSFDNPAFECAVSTSSYPEHGTDISDLIMHSQKQLSLNQFSKTEFSPKSSVVEFPQKQ